MSTLRINAVKSARKAQGNCRGCGEPINKGSAYKWVKSRYGPRSVKCGKCSFRSSETESNDTLSELYGNVESVQDSLDHVPATEELDGLKTQLSDAIESAVDAFREKADNVSEHFPDSELVSDYEDKIDQLETWKQEVDEIDVEYDAEDKLGVETAETFTERVWGELKDKAGECPI